MVIKTLFSGYSFLFQSIILFCAKFQVFSSSKIIVLQMPTFFVCFGKFWHHKTGKSLPLFDYKGSLVRRSDLLTTFWGRDDYFNGRSLDVFIARLRKLLSEDERVKIETVPKVGYVLNVDF